MIIKDTPYRTVLGAIQSGEQETTIKNLSADEINSIAKLLNTKNGLTSLKIRKNHLADEEAQAIAAALKKNTTLTSLTIGRSQISAEGIKAIF